MLTITSTTTPWERRSIWVAAALVAAAVVVVVVLRLATERGPSLLALLPLVGLVPGVVMHLHRPRSITISIDGIRWRGPGWERHRPWDDIGVVGILPPALGVGGAWIAARRRPGAAPAPRLLAPRRLRRPRVDPERDLAGLVPLSHPWADRPTWDVPDDDVVAAIQEHTDDRWIDDLMAADRGR
jgi:hypothetical protein